MIIGLILFIFFLYFFIALPLGITGAIYMNSYIKKAVWARVVSDNGKQTMFELVKENGNSKIIKLNRNTTDWVKVNDLCKETSMEYIKFGG